MTRSAQPAVCARRDTPSQLQFLGPRELTRSNTYRGIARVRHPTVVLLLALALALGGGDRTIESRPGSPSGKRNDEVAVTSSCILQHSYGDRNLDFTRPRVALSIVTCVPDCS
jgi:hypothetical protein